MSFVVIHQKADGADGNADVEGFTLDVANCDKLRHPGQVPVLTSGVDGLARIVWAAEGKERAQFSEPPVPLGYDTITGAPIFEQGKIKPIGYDPVTGEAIYPKAVEPVKAQPAPVAVGIG